MNVHRNVRHPLHVGWHRIDDDLEGQHTMAEIGLKDFETPWQSQERNSTMARRFDRARMPEDHLSKPRLQISDCARLGHCGTDHCPDACWIASRTHRVNLIPQAFAFLNSRPGPAFFVTIANPAWERPIGGLARTRISNVRQWLLRRLDQLEIPAVAVVGFEVSLNVELDGRAFWAGHIHGVIAGVEKSELQKAFVAKKPRHNRYYKPVMVLPVGDLGPRLGYLTKRIAKRRVAYIDKQGRQNRNGNAHLTAQEQLEFDTWLLGLPVGARTILFGCRLHHGKLRPTAN
jgi:hypothetical protein